MKLKRVKRDFFQVVEALDCQFFDDLDALIEEERLEEERLEAYRVMRAENAIKARRIWPRLKWLQEYSPWEHTKEYVPDFFGDFTERKVACKALHEKRERMRWFYRALYDYWMFDIPIPWMTKHMGLKYSRHRKYFLLCLARHKRTATARYRAKRRRIREERKNRKVKARGLLKRDEVPLLELDPTL